MGLHKKKRLPQAEYATLCTDVLNRDGWKCIVCKSRNNLQVHHKMYRSQGGQDSMENLITLCYRCHHMVHVEGSLKV